MKYAMMIAFLAITPSAHARRYNPIETGKLETASINHCLASPVFAKALLEASSKTNGYKMNVSYKIDHTYRTTQTFIDVTLVGRSTANAEDFRKAAFQIRAVNGCWNVSATAVEVSAITEKEFTDFVE